MPVFVLHDNPGAIGFLPLRLEKKWGVADNLDSSIPLNNCRVAIRRAD